MIPIQQRQLALVRQGSLKLAAEEDPNETVSQALDAGDSCRASTLARVLQTRTIAAINARRIAAPFQEPLASAVTDLATRIRCAPAPADEVRGPGEKKGKGKHKHEGHD